MVLKNIVVVGALLGVEAAQAQSALNLKAMMNAKRAAFEDDEMTEERDEDTIDLGDSELDDERTEKGDEDEGEKRSLHGWRRGWKYQVSTLNNYPCKAGWAGQCDPINAITGTTKDDVCRDGKSRDIQGSIQVKQRGKYTILDFDLKNLEPSAIGGIHVHTGDSCDDGATVDSGPAHYWKAGKPDPWNGSTTVWQSDADGCAKGYVKAKSYVKRSSLLGKTLVIHDSLGERIACGVIEREAETMQVRRRGFGKYPGYTGSFSWKLKNRSSVTVETFYHDGAHRQRFCWNLQGLEKKETGGIHIHAGYSCAKAALVYGHHWNKNSLGTDDAWIPVKWNSNRGGRAKGCATVKTDLDASKISGRAVVIHNSGGARMACGIIEARNTLNMQELGEYPGQNPNVGLPMGAASVTTVEPNQGSPAYQRFNYQLQADNDNNGRDWHTKCSDCTLDVTKFDEIAEADLGANYAVRGEVAIQTSSELVLSAEIDGANDALSPAATTAVDGHDYSSAKGLVTVFTTQNSDGKYVQQFSFGLKGLKGGAMGGIHIHKGTDCANSATQMGHYWNTTSLGQNSADDRWIPVKWTADGTGAATGIFEVLTDIEDMSGRVIVVHASSSERVLCKALDIGTSRSVQKMDFRLYGLEKNTAGGIHIHEEPNCSVYSTGSGGGHYWNKVTLGSAAVEYDRWKPVKWKSDAQGRAFGSKYVITDISQALVAGNSVVVHAASGAKLTCGQINPGQVDDIPKLETDDFNEITTPTTDPNDDYDVDGDVAITTSKETVFSAQISAGDGAMLTGSATDGHAYTSVEGLVTVFTTRNADGRFVQQFSFGLKGLKADATGGIHIHEGTNCANSVTQMGHYWNSAAPPAGLGSDDKWIPVKWTANANGEATGIVEVVTDIESSLIKGRVIVLHASSGERVVCKKLDAGTQRDVQKIDYDLIGLEANEMGGMHIHDETNCPAYNSGSGGGGHYWNKLTLGTDATINDRWKPVKWASDGSGNAAGSYYVITDVDHVDIVNKAVVVHRASGSKLSCAKIAQKVAGIRCGVHIHEGTPSNGDDQCSVASTAPVDAEVKGHFWDKQFSSAIGSTGPLCDDWKKVTYRVKDYGSGATPRYKAHSDDNLDSTCRAQPVAVSTNKQASDIENRPIAVHTNPGSVKVGCGTIGEC